MEQRPFLVTNTVAKNKQLSLHVTQSFSSSSSVLIQYKIELAAIFIAIRRILVKLSTFALAQQLASSCDKRRSKQAPALLLRCAI
jgi:hypothetical protein